MKANAAPVLTIFEKKMRLEVPLFQRQYVWEREQHWQPLWEDIARKFTEFLEGRREAPVHFLGAMVMDQKQTPTTSVEKRQVIDGQQRLTTLQIFLAALRDFCRERGVTELADECEGFTANKGMMADPQTDRFKVWPTQLDRSQFADVMLAGSRRAIEQKHPQVRQKYARKPDPRPRMVEAYLYFHDELTSFFLGSEGEPPLRAEAPLADRLAEAFNALRSALQVVVIDLEREDDAQVIFETLNARGQPLLPADLLRNFIFLRAARQGEPQEQLYEQHWRQFDEEFWREEVHQGRLSRPRSDLFMQHFLASRRFADIPIKHLFVEYKFWIERSRPFPTVRDELQVLAQKGRDFRRILEPQTQDPLHPVATVLDAFDIRTAYPLLLRMLDTELRDQEWHEIATMLESYIVRRAVSGLTTKNYNQVFLSLAKRLDQEGVSPEGLRKALSELRGTSTAWPGDNEFAEHWRKRDLYEALPGRRLVHILKRLNETYLDSKMERLQIGGELTIEHLMPQKWRSHWRLPDGTQALSREELWSLPQGDPRAIATRRREALLGTIGNLTLLTQPLNSSVSNDAWDKKQPQLMAASLLPINKPLAETLAWDENAIERRSQDLLTRALRIWPKPDRTS